MSPFLPDILYLRSKILYQIFNGTTIIVLFVSTHGIINLEVWVPAAYDLDDLDVNLLREFGNVAPPGRFAWFIPNEMSGPVTRYYQKNWSNDIQEVHWSFLRDRKLMKAFDVEAEHWRIIEENMRVRRGSQK